MSTCFFFVVVVIEEIIEEVSTIANKWPKMED